MELSLYIIILQNDKDLQLYIPFTYIPFYFIWYYATHIFSFVPFPFNDIQHPIFIFILFLHTLAFSGNLKDAIFW